MQQPRVIIAIDLNHTQTLQQRLQKTLFIDSAVALCAARQQTELIFDELTPVNLKPAFVTYLALHLVSIDTYKHYIMYLEVYHAEFNRSTQHPPTAQT